MSHVGGVSSCLVWRLTKSGLSVQLVIYVFEISISDISATWTHGGTVRIPSDDQSPNDIAGAINQSQATTACLTSTVARLLALAKVPTVSR